MLQVRFLQQYDNKSTTFTKSLLPLYYNKCTSDLQQDDLYRPPVFLNPKTAQGIKLKLSDFKETHFASQISSLNFELLPWQQNYRRYLAGFGLKEK